jgi:hypothetical protein
MSNNNRNVFSHCAIYPVDGWEKSDNKVLSMETVGPLRLRLGGVANSCHLYHHVRLLTFISHVCHCCRLARRVHFKCLTSPVMGNHILARRARGAEKGFPESLLIRHNVRQKFLSLLLAVHE